MGIDTYNVSLTKSTAQSVLNRLFSEVYSLYNQSEPDHEWYNKSVQVLEFSNEVEIGFTHAQAFVLAMIKERWDDLPLSIRMPFSLSWDDFAKKYTRGKAKSTYEGYVLTARIWLIEEFGKGKVVRISQRSEDGSPLIENGKPLYEDKEFIPYQIDFSKLTILNSRARSNNMTEELWEMLVDDWYNCDNLRIAATNGDDLDPTKRYLSYFHLEGPWLCISRADRTIEIAEINWERYDTDDLVKEAIDTLLRNLRVIMDEDKIHVINGK